MRQAPVRKSSLHDPPSRHAQASDNDAAVLAVVRSGADAIVASGVAHETVKDLECLWAQHPAFDAANTVLIDDSPTKASLQPENLLLLPSFDEDPPAAGGEGGGGGDGGGGQADVLEGERFDHLSAPSSAAS